MIACTSPAFTVRSIPLRISLPSATRACNPLISNMCALSDWVRFADFNELADAAFEAHGEKLLRLDRELHRQFLQHLFAEAVDDQRQRVFLREPALPAIEELVVADLRGRGLVLDAGGGIAHLDVGHGVGAALLADQQG